MENNIEVFLNSYPCAWYKIGDERKRDFDFISNLYIKEILTIFEHSPFHVLSCLSFENDIYAITGKNFSLILVSKKLDKNNIYLFTPIIIGIAEFMEFTRKIKLFLKKPKILIQNVSEHWLGLFKDDNTVNKIQVIERSKEEAIYEVKKLNKLEGCHFAHLRNIENKLLKRNTLTFVPVNEDNVKDAHFMLDQWNKTQGKKYEKDKSQKESFIIDNFLRFNTENFGYDFLFELGYINQKPLSMCAIHRSLINKKWRVTYLIKGLNRSQEGGLRGISDATYIHCFRKADEWKIDYLNDGELGNEEGTRKHKLGFLPVRFLKSFDVLV